MDPFAQAACPQWSSCFHYPNTSTSPDDVKECTDLIQPQEHYIFSTFVQHRHCRVYPSFTNHSRPSQPVRPPKKRLRSEIKPDTPFDLGSFDDWIGRDDPADNTLSPTTTDLFPELKMEATSPNMPSIEPLPAARSQYRNVGISNGVEESGAVFGDVQMDQPLFQTSEQPREILYSTPLALSPPISKIRNFQAYCLAPALSPRQKSELIAQAMP